MRTAAFGSPRRCGGAVSRGRDFLLARACLTCDFPRSASVWEIQCFQRGSAPVTVTLKETLHTPVCAFRGCALMCPLLLFCSFPAGRGSFRPIQSSLTKAALSRPIVPKALPPQATGHLASKFLSSVTDTTRGYRVRFLLSSPPSRVSHYRLGRTQEPFPLLGNV